MGLPRENLASPHPAFILISMRNFTIIILGVLFGAGLFACGKGGVAISVNGVAVHENEWKAATSEIGARLRFEHDCDGPYEFVLIKKEYKYPSEVGVVACNRKWIFTRETDGITAGPWKGRQTAFSFIPPEDRGDKGADKASAPETASGAAPGTPSSLSDRTNPYETDTAEGAEPADTEPVPESPPENTDTAEVSTDTP